MCSLDTIPVTITPEAIEAGIRRGNALHDAFIRKAVADVLAWIAARLAHHPADTGHAVHA